MTELDVVLFHGLQLTASDINDAWTSTWTQRGHDNVCWPREWLPFHLGEAVRHLLGGLFHSWFICRQVPKSSRCKCQFRKQKLALDFKLRNNRIRFAFQFSAMIYVS
jgi:hypothetical protein